MSYDSVEILTTFAGRAGISFPLLADPGYRVIDAFGIVNQEVPKDSPHYGFAYAGYYLVDADGLVTAKFFNEENNDRVTSASILVRRFDAPGDSRQGEAETDHLTLRWSASNPELRPGQRVALVLEVEPKDGMHVYAPGVEGYIPVAWTMSGVDGAQLPAPRYPPSVSKHLPAIDETVEVYEGAFRVLGDVRLLGGRRLPEELAGRDELVLEGEFKYQACDAKKCYFPRTIPLQWTLKLAGHDLTRVPEGMRRVPPEGE